MMNASPRSRRRARTRARILDAARGVVAHEGIDGLTLGAIARELDLTTPALYRYFPNKGALLAAVNAEVLLEQRAVLQRIERRADRRDPLVTVAAISEALVALASEQPDDFALLVATLADPRTLVDDPSQAVHMPALVGMLVELTTWVQRAQEAGSLSPGDARERALTGVFSVLGCLQTGKLARFVPGFDVAALARRASRDTLLGWGADPAAVDPSLREAAQLVRDARTEDLS